AFRINNGVATDIGTLGGRGAMAFGINNSGQVVGASNTVGSRHAFLYANGTMSDLGTLGGYQDSQAQAINNNGQVVGYSAGSNDPSINHHARATLWNNGLIVDLEGLSNGPTNAIVSDAISINDN
ncbi:MAG: HAF repeat-containing protein, partial [Candidatus Saccharibacteria bacterium]|nr:HAF repeat-containing protein [Candidatus Saccharibacteria bacterium]